MGFLKKIVGGAYHAVKDKALAPVHFVEHLAHGDVKGAIREGLSIPGVGPVAASRPLGYLATGDPKGALKSYGDNLSALAVGGTAYGLGTGLAGLGGAGGAGGAAGAAGGGGAGGILGTIGGVAGKLGTAALKNPDLILAGLQLYNASKQGAKASKSQDALASLVQQQIANQGVIREAILKRLQQPETPVNLSPRFADPSNPYAR